MSDATSHASPSPEAGAFALAGNAAAALSELGLTRYGVVPVGDMVFSETFRTACEENQCGKFGTNWACPPGAGEAAALIANARRFRRGLVIQTVWPLEDAFDFDGMMAGGKKHAEVFRRAVERVAPLLSCGATLALGAGACTFCETCSYLSGAPCRAPARAIASLESYCVDVTALVSRAGLAYTNGPDTVSYVGLILF